MHVVQIECRGEEKDLVVADLWERGTAGVVEEELPGGRFRLRAYFEARVEVTGLWSEEAPQDWVAVAQSQWEPLCIGEGFFLAPSWCADPTPPGRVRLEMQPGMACGTGWHPATQLALEAMERHLAPGSVVLDLGTGSGILAVAAARLGAGRLFACDIDAEAAAVAHARFLREEVAAGLFVGSLRSVRAGSIDFLVANLNAEALAALAPEILRVLRPGGRAILTGFPERHLERVRAAFPGEVLAKGEWRAVVH